MGKPLPAAAASHKAAPGKPAVPAAKPCPVRSDGCVTCHMPKVELPDAHFKFTDHRIRIVRPRGNY